MKKIWKNLLLFVLMAALCIGTVACSKEVAEKSDYYSDDYASSEGTIYYSKVYDSEENITEKKEEQADVSESRKIIRTLKITAETKKFDEVMSTLQTDVKAAGGYFESFDLNARYYGSRYASITIRVPEKIADEFLSGLRETVNVLREYESNTDITTQYSDVESHLKALRVQEERLLELLAEAKTMSDLLTIEDKLTSVRYQIESYESQRRTYDNQVNYVTIYFSLDEVETETVVSDNIFTRMGEGFMECLRGVGEFFEELLVGLVSALPALVVLAAVVVLIVALIRRRIRKNKEKKAGKAAAQGKAE